MAGSKKYFLWSEVKMTDRQYAELKLFLCKGISCSKCPFFEIHENREKCGLSRRFSDDDIGPELFATVKKNKAYFNRCKELNGQYWDTIKTLFGATLK